MVIGILMSDVFAFPLANKHGWRWVRVRVSVRVSVIAHFTHHLRFRNFSIVQIWLGIIHGISLKIRAEVPVQSCSDGEFHYLMVTRYEWRR